MGKPSQRALTVSDGEALVKIRADLSGDEHLTGESFWAKPLGDHLYEMRNSPFLAPDLHFGDIVRALPDEPGAKPTIRAVVERSGHQTLRILFSDDAPASSMSDVLRRLRDSGADYESSGRFFAFNMPPGCDFAGVCAYLYEREREGVLEYETGTANPGAHAN